jgi:hypothetical protein
MLASEELLKQFSVEVIEKILHYDHTYLNVSMYKIQRLNNINITYIHCIH